MSDGTFPAAPWWRRAAARAIDLALLSPPLWWLEWQWRRMPEMGMEGIAIALMMIVAAFVWALVGWAAYDVIALARFGATAGKRLMGIEVRAVDGARLRPAPALARSVSTTVPLVVLSAVLVVGGGGGTSLAGGLLPAGVVALWWLVQAARGDGRTSYDRRAGSVVVLRGALGGLPVEDDRAAAGHPAPGRFAARVLVGGVLAVVLVSVHWWAAAHSGRFVPALLAAAAGVGVVWWLWRGSSRRWLALTVVVLWTVWSGVSLGAQLDDSPERASARLVAALQERGYAPLDGGVRSEHCHRGWEVPDCPAADDGPDLRRRGTAADAIRDVLAAARAAGMDTSFMDDPYTSPGPAAVVVQSGRSMFVVSISTDDWNQSTLPPGVVAVWWKAQS